VRSRTTMRKLRVVLFLILISRCAGMTSCEFCISALRLWQGTPTIQNLAKTLKDEEGDDANVLAMKRHVRETVLVQSDLSDPLNPKTIEFLNWMKTENPNFVCGMTGAHGGSCACPMDQSTLPATIQEAVRHLKSKNNDLLRFRETRIFLSKNREGVTRFRTSKAQLKTLALANLAMRVRGCGGSVEMDDVAPPRKAPKDMDNMKTPVYKSGKAEGTQPSTSIPQVTTSVPLSVPMDIEVPTVALKQSPTPSTSTLSISLPSGEQSEITTNCEIKDLSSGAQGSVKRCILASNPLYGMQTGADDPPGLKNLRRLKVTSPLASKQYYEDLDAFETEKSVLQYSNRLLDGYETKLPDSILRFYFGANKQILMEYVDAESGIRFETTEQLDIFAQSAIDGLVHLGSLGILRADWKIANILQVKTPKVLRGKAKMIDFGFSQTSCTQSDTAIPTGVAGPNCEPWICAFDNSGLASVLTHGVFDNFLIGEATKFTSVERKIDDSDFVDQLRYFNEYFKQFETLAAGGCTTEEEPPNDADKFARPCDIKYADLFNSFAADTRWSFESLEGDFDPSTVNSKGGGVNLGEQECIEDFQYTDSLVGDAEENSIFLTVGGVLEKKEGKFFCYPDFYYFWHMQLKDDTVEFVKSSLYNDLVEEKLIVVKELNEKLCMGSYITTTDFNANFGRVFRAYFAKVKKKITEELPKLIWYLTNMLEVVSTLEMKWKEDVDYLESLESFENFDATSFLEGQVSGRLTLKRLAWSLGIEGTWDVKTRIVQQLYLFGSSDSGLDLKNNFVLRDKLLRMQKFKEGALAEKLISREEVDEHLFMFFEPFFKADPPGPLLDRLIYWLQKLLKVPEGIHDTPIGSIDAVQAFYNGDA